MTRPDKSSSRLQQDQFAGAGKAIHAASENLLPIAVRSTGADGLRTRH